MNLLQKYGPDTAHAGQQTPVRGHRLGVIPHMIAKIEAVIGVF
jgi:hypothetical protein